jgi:5'-nucleotidase
MSDDSNLVIAISSTALFDMRESHEIFEREGVDGFAEYQRQNEQVVLAPGDAFPLVNKLLRLNERLVGKPQVEIILLSRNSADTGLRVFNSIAHYGLKISRAAFSGGNSPYRYVKAFACHLFLSTNHEDVRNALNSGIAAATLLPSVKSRNESDQLRFAFDGDAVLFSDASERIFKEHGLEAFTENEARTAHLPMDPGPFKSFLEALHHLQSQFESEDCPIRTALITARSAPSHERVILTLREWNIRIDESLFLGGLDKIEFLRSFGADVFFDDQKINCVPASRYLSAGHVPHGVTNEN